MSELIQPFGPNARTFQYVWHGKGPGGVYDKPVIRIEITYDPDGRDEPWVLDAMTNVLAARTLAALHKEFP